MAKARARGSAMMPTLTPERRSEKKLFFISLRVSQLIGIKSLKKLFPTFNTSHKKLYCTLNARIFLGYGKEEEIYGRANQSAEGKRII